MRLKIHETWDINNHAAKKLNLNLKILKLVSFLPEFKISSKQAFKTNYATLRSKKKQFRLKYLIINCNDHKGKFLKRQCEEIQDNLFKHKFFAIFFS